MVVEENARKQIVLCDSMLQRAGSSAGDIKKIIRKAAVSGLEK